MIPYGRQNISDDDINAVIEVLKSPFITQGPAIANFEQAICQYTQTQYGVAVNSATSALHIACLALDVKKGDVVWTSPNSFVASANCALYCGASVDFVDIDPQTYNMSADALEEKLKITQKVPKVVIPVAFAGQSANMKRIKELSLEYGFSIIEDASHAIGGYYDNKPIGCGLYADITIFSFHPVKIITTGEGGMAVTNSAELYQKMILFRSHGVTRDPSLISHNDVGGWYYEQINLGMNYRITDLQAALGVSQVQRLTDFISQRHAVRKRYEKKLEDLPVTVPYQDTDCYSALHLYPICIEDPKLRRHIFEELRAQGIGVNVHYIPIHMQPYYQAMGFKQGDFPKAETYYSKAISLPMYPDLSEEDQDTVCLSLQQALQSVYA